MIRASPDGRLALIPSIISASRCGKLHPLDRRDGSFAKFLMPLLATVDSKLHRASLSPSLFFRNLSPRAIPSLKRRAILLEVIMKKFLVRPLIAFAVMVGVGLPVL